MSKRVQVILDDRVCAEFQRSAEQEGVSLSAWLRDAGRERLASRAEENRPLRTRAELAQFFARGDAAEAGREPDWDQHVAVIEGSRRRGLADS